MSDPRHAIDAMLDMVDRFNREIIGLPIPGKPKMLDADRKQWSCTAFEEEMTEFKEAKTIEDEADALIDLTYFALGRLVEMGLAPLPLFEQVHGANMKKKRGELSKRPAARGFDAVKPEGWKPPDLMPFLCINWKDLYEHYRLDKAMCERKEPPTQTTMKGILDKIETRSRTEKDTVGKAPVSRIPEEAIIGEAEVFEFGSKKYAWDGFKESPPSVHDLVSAIMRHAMKIASGEDLDLGPNGEHGQTDDSKTNMKWSGKPHWAHIRCCTSMLAWVMKFRPDRDDRYAKKQKAV